MKKKKKRKEVRHDHLIPSTKCINTLLKIGVVQILTFYHNNIAALSDSDLLFLFSLSLKLLSSDFVEETLHKNGESSLWLSSQRRNLSHQL